MDVSIKNVEYFRVIVRGFSKIWSDWWEDVLFYVVDNGSEENEDFESENLRF